MCTQKLNFAVISFNFFANSQRNIIINKNLDSNTASKSVRANNEEREVPALKARITIKSSLVNVGVLIGHNESLDTLKKKVKNWLRETNFRIYYKTLHMEQGTEFGWLLYSTRKMNVGPLADMIEKMLGFPV